MLCVIFGSIVVCVLILCFIWGVFVYDLGSGVFFFIFKEENFVFVDD